MPNIHQQLKRTPLIYVCLVFSYDLVVVCKGDSYNSFDEESVCVYRQGVWGHFV